MVSLIKALRPKQWTKNVLLYAGFLFTLNKKWFLFAPSMWQALAKATLAMIVFTALASGIYLLNDVQDLPQDRLHPKKRSRPIAAGHVPIWLALVMTLLLEGVGLWGAFALAPSFGWVGLAYVLIQLAYTYSLKHMVIIDVFVLASGFVLRAVSGVLVLSADISPWLYIVTFLGSLFLGLCKRRHELSLLADDAGPPPSEPVALLDRAARSDDQHCDGKHDHGLLAVHVFSAGVAAQSHDDADDPVCALRDAALLVPGPHAQAWR